VTADIERRVLARQPHGIVKRGAVGHQSRGGENAVAMGLDNTLIDVPRESKIVGVYN
jgi:hypothetical protein